MKHLPNTKFFVKKYSDHITIIKYLPSKIHCWFYTDFIARIFECKKRDVSIIASDLASKAIKWQHCWVREGKGKLEDGG